MDYAYEMIKKGLGHLLLSKVSLLIFPIVPVHVLNILNVHVLLDTMRMHPSACSSREWVTHLQNDRAKMVVNPWIRETSWFFFQRIHGKSSGRVFRYLVSKDRKSLIVLKVSLWVPGICVSGMPQPKNNKKPRIRFIQPFLPAASVLFAFLFGPGQEFGPQDIQLWRGCTQGLWILSLWVRVWRHLESSCLGNDVPYNPTTRTIF